MGRANRAAGPPVGVSEEADPRMVSKPNKTGQTAREAASGQSAAPRSARKAPRLPQVVNQFCLKLQGEDKPESVFDLLEQLPSEAARGLGQDITIDGNDLGDVDDGVFRKTGGLRRDEYVAGRFDESQI